MKSNEQPRGPDWELYRVHRQHFTRAVLALTPAGGGTLCVLGAGKCNDLDLAQLASAYRQVHLVDLDPASVAGAISREDESTRAKLVPHTPVDLSVLSPKRASKWQRRAPTQAELTAAADQTLQGLVARLPGPFDVVVSACVLTQLGFALTQSLGEKHPLLGALRSSIAETHLRTLIELTRPGGKSLFVSDLASSTHYPLDALPPGSELTSVMADVLGKRAFYHLAHPGMVRQLLAPLASEPLTELTPWLWTGPRQRTYLVYGVVATP